jgi:serine/threonine protein kinase/WD40 repeat protein
LQRLEELFHRAIDLPRAEHGAFLDRECADDADLRATLEDMLQRDREDVTDDGRLVSPVARDASGFRHDAPTLLAGSAAAQSPVKPTFPEVPGYELLEELGRGGMGVVYKARQRGLNRLVALKMLLPFAAPTPEQLARFRTEAEALARLSHPNVVPIYEVGECAAGPYFSMEFIDGPSLSAYLDGRPCAPADAARLIELLAGAIDAVHHCGIVHRDLKPANILLQMGNAEWGAGNERHGRRDHVVRIPHSPFPIPKITDFGLAKDRSARQALTVTGTTMGTPCYMAPEQAGSRRGSVGPAADIYALGAILYEMLTGRPPFDAESPAKTVAMVLEEEPTSPSRLRPGLPRDLVTICAKCLEKSPRRRYATAALLADDLRRFQAGESIQARPVGPIGRTYRWCRRKPLVAGLMALCALLVVAFAITVLVYDIKLQAALQRAEGKAEDERQQIVRLNVTIGITEMENGDNFSAVLRFAEALRQDAGSPERERVHRTRIAAALRQSPKLKQLVLPTGRLLCTRLAESGGRIATVTDDHVVEMWDTDTGRQIGQRLPLGSAVSSGSFSPDGRFLATLGPGRTVRVWNLDDASPRTIDHAATEVNALVYDASGRLLLSGSTGSERKVWDLSETTNGIAPLPSLPAGSEIVFAEDGRHALAVSTNGTGRVWDMTTGEPFGPAIKLPTGSVRYAISTDGRRIATLANDQDLRVVEGESGRDAGPVAHPGAPVRLLVFSPDGERLLTAATGHRAQVWTPATGKLVSQLSAADTDISIASFSPDGRLLATGDEERGARLWDADTGEPLTPPLRQAKTLARLQFLADGHQLAMVGPRGVAAMWDLPPYSQTRTVRAASGQSPDDVARAARSARETVGEERVRPDGKHLALRSAENGACVVDAATGEVVAPALLHAGIIRRAAFSDDGARLITVTPDGTVGVWDVATGEPLAPAGRMTVPVVRVGFEKKGERAIVTCADGGRMVLDLTPDSRPMEELTALAQELSCGRIDAGQRNQALDANDLRSIHDKLPAH